MAAPLPRLRADLDIMPSPVRGAAGADRARSVPVLRGDPADSAAAGALPRLLRRRAGRRRSRRGDRAPPGQVAVGSARRLIASLHDAGFLDDDRFAELRGAREREFAALAERASAHAGSGYPSDIPALNETLRGYFNGTSAKAKAQREGQGERRATRLLGIAAPHVSPEGGSASYAAAYRALPDGPTRKARATIGSSSCSGPRTTASPIASG